MGQKINPTGLRIGVIRIGNPVGMPTKLPSATPS